MSATLALFPREQTVDVDSTDAQCTPRDLALDLGRFGTDPCSNPRSHILADLTYMLERGQNGLAEIWLGDAFVNGCYSDPLPWCERLRDHRDGGWCALWKMDSTTKWWRELMAARPYWAPFRDRLPFERPGNVGAADFVSVLVWKDWKPSRAVLRRLWSPRRERRC